MRPTLSVMTPMYNCEKFVERCYFMLRRQTFTDWEWVVVNDGSTDDTEPRIRAIDDPRIKLVSYQPNRGRGYARNEALRAARGDWLVVWDADDVYFPDRLEKANQARLAGYDFCCSYAVLIDNDLRITGLRGFVRDDSGTSSTFMHASSSCKLELARAIGYDPGLPTGEDAGLILHLARKCHGHWLQDTVIANQHVREVNIHKTISANRARLATYRMLYHQGVLDISQPSYAKTIFKLKVKLAALNLFRLFPALYLKTVSLRSSGSIDDGWQLPAARQVFLEELRQRHQDNDWSIGPPARLAHGEAAGRKLLKAG